MNLPAGRAATFAQTARRIAALVAPYFKSEEKWLARGLLFSIVTLNLGTVYMLVLNNEWYGRFYDALQNKDQVTFWKEIVFFCWIAAAFIVIAILKFYLTQLFQMRWRAWMTRDYLGRWMANNTYYRLELARYAATSGATPDNPDQRIQEDMQLFTSYTVSLTMGLLNAAVTLISFVGILWGLSGTASFSLGGQTYAIAGSMVWIALAYCAVGTIITHYIGRPLINLNFQQQRYEADFRHHLVRVREYSEAIALDRGQTVEHQQLDTRFGAVLKNYLQLIRKQKNLVAFTASFGQASVIFAFIVQAPRFFSGAIQLGQLMQVNSAFGRVQDSLSWIVDNYDSIAAWRATTDRLTSFEEAMRAQANAHASLQINTADQLNTQDLTINLPDGATLLAGAALSIHAGDTMLLQGPSGSGKSTLFRAFAGIWPFASGHAQVPQDAMFIPQRPYVPNGRLRDALTYPSPSSDYTDEDLRQALADAYLPHLSSRLDDEDAWAQKLSGGEQQRLAIARVLLRQPRWVFADEATSALDESTEHAVYEKLINHVRQANGALVSIAHRPAVAAFHDKHWALQKAPEGAAARYTLTQQVA